MATDLNTAIDAIHPASGVNAVLVGDQVWIIFDREVDESSVKGGNFFVTGPDNDTWSGPDLALWQNPNGSQTEEDILTSPGLAGIVQGAYTFDRLSLSGLNSVTTKDVVGSGSLYRSKIIFTPTHKFTPDTTWSVYLLGDEDSSDSLKSGIRPRSVFDTEQTGSGSSDLTFTGTYDGTLTTDVINVQIVTSGVLRTATFNWWLSSTPATIHGPVLSDKQVYLRDGVYVEFGEGIFSTNDEFTAVLVKADPFVGSLIWTFQTGSGSIQTIPTSVSTTVLGSLVPSIDLAPTSTPSSTFKVVSTTPSDRKTNLTVTTNQIIIEFDSAVDPTTVDSDKIKIFGYPVDGDQSLFADTEIFKDITVSGTKIIIDI